MIESQVDGLRVEYRRGKQVVLHTDHRVGVVALPDGPTIEIQPKIGDPNLVTLLRYANGAEPTHLSRETELESGTNFVDTVAALFLEELEAVLSQGLRREYVDVEGTEEYLRGRLNVQRQLAGGPGKTDFECDYDEFTYDTTLNQTILCVANVLSSVVDGTGIAGELREYESRLRRRVTLREVSIEEAERIELTRLTDYYEKVLVLSRLVLKHIYIEDIVAGEGASYSLLIGMNDVFEKVVERTARETVDERDGWSVEGQARTDNLLRGSPPIRMRPDFVVKRHGEPVLVGDAKWKTGVKNNDVYQVVAYQTAYDAPCVLVYPDNDGAVENDYSVKNGHSLAMLELPTGVNTADVHEFGRENVERFFDFLSRTVG
ncbi:5-methylcytosine-specific restriction enzyme subunit McrC [Halobacterium jilantaiense]|uniref:5-methylcytosine-specific restriction enzyme subunit McrC n=2 Tax=Halobacterium jilantaiense TaxID=355548 RepID=A0A1I0R526_9EURY|nr:5-methylcytosine-specific restriction enzyme subunit McrC [Halobacterium jilantaiense]